MIEVFLDPYEDELLWSAVARTAAALRYPSQRTLLDQLFGNGTVVATVTLPSHLEALCARLPSQALYTADELIDRNSLLPVFSPFLPPARVAQIRADMRADRAASLYARAGLMASTVPLPATLRYCPRCAAEDRDRLGETYWHRLHQVPGVHVCPIHRVWVEESEAQVTNRLSRHTLRPAEDVLPPLLRARPVQLESPLDRILLHIAAAAAWLLNHPGLLQGMSAIRQHYLNALREHDLASLSGRVRIRDLHGALLQAYPPHVLAFLHCPLDPRSGATWLERLIHAPRSAHHPVRHLLLMHFLHLDMTRVLAPPHDPPAPFGSGPWPCLNPTCDHFHQAVIGTCRITVPPSAGGRPTGTFVCTCGYSYARSGPDTKPEDMLRRGKLVSVGPQWENTLRLRWHDPVHSIRSIATALGVDPVTVTRHAARLGLPPRGRPRRAIPSTQPALSGNRHRLSDDRQQDKAATMRAQWREARKATAGVSAARRIAPGAYAWLYRHDRVWLAEQNARCSGRSAAAYCQAPPRVDWPARDREIAARVPDAVAFLYSQPGRPRRISAAAIGSALQVLALLHRYRDRLPVTARAITLAVETGEAAAVRRIQWIASQIPAEEPYPPPWELIRRSGAGRWATSRAVQDAVASALRRFQPTGSVVQHAS